LDWRVHRVSRGGWFDPLAIGLCGNFLDPAFCDGKSHRVDPAAKGREGLRFRSNTEAIGIELPRLLTLSRSQDGFAVLPVGVEKKGMVLAMNKLFKLLLKTAIFVIDQSTEQVDRASDGVAEMIDRGKSMIQPEDNRIRNVVSLAAGIGIGVGAAILFAPASGAETRRSISGKVREFRGQAV
jgi:hypothetical protein